MNREPTIFGYPVVLILDADGEALDITSTIQFSPDEGLFVDPYAVADIIHEHEVSHYAPNANR